MKLKPIIIGAVFCGVPIWASAADNITVVKVPATITSDTTWDSDQDDNGQVDTVYLLDETTSVRPANLGSGWTAGVDAKVTLTVEPGTIVAGTGSVTEVDTGPGDVDFDADPDNDGDDDVRVVGSLVITRGARLDADGTMADPITFTSVEAVEARLGVDIDGDLATNTIEPSPVNGGGSWGGVLLLGNAPINWYDGSSSVGETSVEGFPAGSAADILYGGSISDDDSGTLRYVRIEFGGFEFAPNDEINGLTLGGVGSGTTVSFVEVVGNTDDGFEFFGGTVNTSYLVSAFNQDESFDFDQGHSGTHQFLFALQSTLSDNGVEADGGDGENGPTKTGLPLTNTKVYNATFIGGGPSSSRGSSNDGFRLKDNFAGQFHSSLFHDFAGQAMRIDDAPTSGQVGGNLLFNNNHFGIFASGSTQNGSGPLQTAETNLLGQTGNTAVGTDPVIGMILRGASGNPLFVDPQPQAGSPLLGATVTVGAPMTTSYRGAFDGTTNWADGWSFLGEMGFFTAPAADHITVVKVPATITSDTTWDSDQDDNGQVDTVYLLDETTSVRPANLGSGWTAGVDAKVTLTIEPGTIVAGTGSVTEVDTGPGDVDFDADPDNDGDDDVRVVGSLVITRGARLDADGTMADPITFTSVEAVEARLGVDIDGDLATNTIEPSPVNGGGSWGGVLLLGNAPINWYDGSSSVGETSVEGFPAGSAADILYGGSISDDDSGTLRYVRIEFGGFEFAPNDEINGLTLGGVGSGTTVSFVEVVGNTDDGFEFFGGTVNTSYLVSAFNQDESFDFDQGHSGTHQFLFALQSTLSDNGVEADGGDGENGPTKTGLPLTNTKVYNATFIGGGPSSSRGSSNDGFRLKDNFAGQFHSSLFHDFAGQAMRIDDAPTSGQVGGNLLFNNNHFGIFASGSTQNGSGPLQTAETNLLGQTGNTAVGTDPVIGMILRGASGNPLFVDPQPQAGSPLLGATVTVGAPMATSYRGAFDGTTNWADGWSFLGEMGFFTAPAADHITVVKVPATITSDTTWDSDQDDNGQVDTVYLLDETTSVRPANLGSGWTAGVDAKVTLTVEPGTIVAGTGSVTEVDTGPGDVDFDADPDNDGDDDVRVVGSLVITRGARLDADGTMADPITFTSVEAVEARLGVDIDGDLATNTIEPSPVNGGGSWGGVLLLGNAPINWYDGSSSVGETSVEGFPAGSAADILYGGSISDDDSGTLRYVRIEFGGFEFAPNDEINGLTLGGVGSGTTVSFVEVVGNTDDGFEFFGGTVNTSYLVSAFNQDESFDFDQGHSGTHQFLFALQSTLSDNGVEADGGDGENGPTKTGLPLTNTKVYNATFIGGGPSSSRGSSNDGFRLKDNFAGQFHSSLFHDFAGQAMRIDDAPTSGQVGGNLLFNNNHFGIFASGSTQNGSGPLQTAETNLLGQTGNTAVGTDPVIGMILRGASGNPLFVDPQPQAGSPLLGATVTVGAPMTTSYRGAFDGTTNWADGWSFLGEMGFFGAATGGDDYDTYAAGFVPPLGAAGADDDLDGQTNDFERLFGLDPQSSSSINPIVVPLDASAGTFSYTRRDVGLSGADYEIWTSPDLMNWSMDSGASQTATLLGEVETVDVVLSATPVDGKLFVQIRTN